MGQIDRKQKVLQNITFIFGFFKKGGSDFKEQLCMYREFKNEKSKLI